jgi:hypothetical protein
MISKEQFKDALRVIESYEKQVRDSLPKETHEVGCRVKLSEWGIEMQGNNTSKGTVIEVVRGAVCKLTDATVLIKWDDIPVPDWMHIDHIASIEKRVV